MFLLISTYATWWNLFDHKNYRSSVVYFLKLFELMYQRCPLNWKCFWSKCLQMQRGCIRCSYLFSFVLNYCWYLFIVIVICCSYNLCRSLFKSNKMKAAFSKSDCRHSRCRELITMDIRYKHILSWNRHLDSFQI
jgi:hypothetical protein